MSSIITEDVKKISNQLGIVAYFEKPFDLHELQEEVSRAIKANMESASLLPNKAERLGYSKS